MVSVAVYSCIIFSKAFLQGIIIFKYGFSCPRFALDTKVIITFHRQATISISTFKDTLGKGYTGWNMAAKHLFYSGGRVFSIYCCTVILMGVATGSFCADNPKCIKQNRILIAFFIIYNS
jgi:hypothetical protein